MKSIQKKDWFMKICQSLLGIISQNIENIDMNQWMNQKTAKQTISKRRNRKIEEKLAIKIIMVCRTIAAHKFRARLRFKQYNMILTKEHSWQTKMITSFEGENMQHSIAQQIIGLIYTFITINLQQKLIKLIMITEILPIK